MLGIVNAGALPLYDDIESELLNICEEILWNKSSDSTEKMLNYCQNNNTKANSTTNKDAEWRNWSVEKRLEHSLVKVCKFLIMRMGAFLSPTHRKNLKFCTQSISQRI